jgi:hypothetical protein
MSVWASSPARGPGRRRELAGVVGRSAFGYGQMAAMTPHVGLVTDRSYRRALGDRDGVVVAGDHDVEHGLGQRRLAAETLVNALQRDTCMGSDRRDRRRPEPLRSNRSCAASTTASRRARACSRRPDRWPGPSAGPCVLERLVARAAEIGAGSSSASPRLLGGRRRIGEPPRHPQPRQPCSVPKEAASGDGSRVTTGTT